MPVYAIQAGGDCGPIKIGHGDARKRLMSLQVGNHLALRIVRIWEGGIAEEASLHDRFKDLWIRGEWHSFSRAMFGDVGLVELFGPGKTPNFKPIEAEDSGDDGYHSWAIDRCGGVVAVSRSLRVDKSTVAKWRTRKIPGRYWQDLTRLASTSDGAEVSAERLLKTSKVHGRRLQVYA